jgi:hypothetical protein
MSATTVLEARGAAERLAASSAALAALLGGVDRELARWRPGEARWSLVEIACHLLDEERADFRARLALLLSERDEPFAPIDPEGWVVARRYRERDLAEVQAELAGERERSLAWLRSLDAPDLARARTAPWGGPLRAGDVLAAWVAHDLLHLRQATGVLHARAGAEAAPFATDYAGRW